MAYFISMKEEFAFREVFGREAVRKQFVSDVVGIPQEEIRSVRIVSPFLRKGSRKQKLGILDLALTLNDDTKMDVELQLRSQRFWVKRNLFYLAHLYADELWVGENYDKLKKCITISILDFNLVPGAEYHTVYTLRDKRGRELTDLFEVHIVELKKKLSGEEPVDGWIRLFNAKTKGELDMIKSISAGLFQAVEVLERLSLTRALRWRFEQSLKERRDRWAEDEYVREEGRQEGKADHIVELVSQNKAKGRTVDEIAEFLGEDLETVAALYASAGEGEGDPYEHF